VAVVAVGVGKSVMRNELQTLRQPLLHLHLKRVVIAGCVVTVVVAKVESNLGAIPESVFWSAERPAFILRKHLARYGVYCVVIRHGYWVDVVVRSVAGKAVRTLGADI